MKSTILLVIFFAIISPITARCQTISTIAGGATGHGGYWGDGGPATAAQLVSVPAIAVDACGNIYIAAGYSNRVLKVDVLTGIISTVAGTGVAGYSGDGGPATAAMLYGASYMDFDLTGNLCFGDAGNYRIRKIDGSTGIISTIVGTGIGGYGGDGGLATATSIDGGDFAFDRFGNMYMGDIRRVVKISATGIISTVAGTGITGVTAEGVPATSTNFGNSIGTAVDTAGNVYFVDSLGSIRKVTVSTGIINRVAGTEVVGTYTGDGLPATACRMSPFDFVFDDSMNMYTAEYSSHRVIKINSMGITRSIVGTGTMGFSGDGGAATAAQLRYLKDVALDPLGNLYIADFGNNRVRKVAYSSIPIVAPTIAITASPGDTACAGSMVAYTATTTGLGGFTYQWYVNGTAVAGATSSTYAYAPAHGDTVQCRLRACYGTPIASNTLRMVVLPEVTPTVVLAGPAAAPMGSSVAITATVTGAGSSYLLRWYNRGLWFATTTVPTTTYTKAAGIDTISARVVPVGGHCIDSATSVAHMVSVLTSVSVAGAGFTACSIYPNPAGNTLTISAPGLSGICITNLLGRMVLAVACGSDEVHLDIAGLSAGVYVVRVTNANGAVAVRRVVKE